MVTTHIQMKKTQKLLLVSLLDSNSSSKPSSKKEIWPQWQKPNNVWNSPKKINLL
jgi:hypothetical protein